MKLTMKPLIGRLFLVPLILLSGSFSTSYSDQVASENGTARFTFSDLIKAIGIDSSDKARDNYTKAAVAYLALAAADIRLQSGETISSADGTFTFGRDTSGVITITTKDNDAEAALTIKTNNSEIKLDPGTNRVFATGNIEVIDTTPTTGTASIQAVAGDLNIAAGYGESALQESAFLAGVMGNALGSNLTTTKNYVAGVIGHYTVTGTNASTYPKGAVIGGIGDGTTTADGAFVAYIDGDSGPLTKAEAAFKVMHNNSTAGNKFSYGLDLSDEARDGYLPVSFATADIRLQKGETISNAIDGAIKFSGSVIYNAIITFANGDATPSVLGGNIFKEANSGATTITTFDDGVSGQAITVIFTTANTTIAKTGNIRLSDSFTSTPDDTLTLVYDGAKWYEVTRSIN